MKTEMIEFIQEPSSKNVLYFCDNANGTVYRISAKKNILLYRSRDGYNWYTLNARDFYGTRISYDTMEEAIERMVNYCIPHDHSIQLDRSAKENEAQWEIITQLFDEVRFQDETVEYLETKVAKKTKKVKKLERKLHKAR